MDFIKSLLAILSTNLTGSNLGSFAARSVKTMDGFHPLGGVLFTLPERLFGLSMPSPLRGRADARSNPLRADLSNSGEFSLPSQSAIQKKNPLIAGLFLNGALGEIRTPDHLVRSQVLYPTELRALDLKAGILRILNMLCQPFLQAIVILADALPDH
jgi:hypothetical protein